MSLWEEIHEQPGVLRRTIASTRRLVPAIASALEAADVRYVVLAARGSSDNAARFAQYLWTPGTRLPVMLAAPSTFHHAAPPRLDGALVVGVSQSGRSPDLVGVLAEATRQGRPTIALTNDIASPLAGVAAHVVPLAGSIGARLAATLEGSDRCAVLGRGLDLATAHEWALKTTELTGVLAHAWSYADFRHGPVALAEDGFPVLAVSTDPTHRDEAIDLLRDVARRGARVGLLADRPTDGIDATVEVLPEAGVPGGAVTGAVAAQLATYQLAVDRGRDPDAPPGLHKVTRTR